MSDEPKKRSHTRRLMLTMIVGGLSAGIIFAPAVGNLNDPWFRASPYAYAIAGVLAGLAVELFRRFLEAPLNSRAKPQKP